jgi:hypothetical protein
VTERFPELAALGEALPDGTVLDGEIVVWREGKPQPFAELQKRIGRKTLGPKILRELPVALLAYDLLEHAGQDLRAQPLHVRRAALEALVQALHHPLLVASPVLPVPPGPSWRRCANRPARAAPKASCSSTATAATAWAAPRPMALWWKWKIDPMSVDAVLIYAQRGHGRRASVYSDYTFAVWNAPQGTEGRQLVPFAKAYSGLTDAEMARVDAVIRQTTLESFGPVRSVRPTLVFELGFEGIARSPRHKSGIAVRFPRMLRWREDKPVDEADTLQTLARHDLLPGCAVASCWQGDVHAPTPQKMCAKPPHTRGLCRRPAAGLDGRARLAAPIQQLSTAPRCGDLAVLAHGRTLSARPVRRPAARHHRRKGKTYAVWLTGCAADAPGADGCRSTFSQAHARPLPPPWWLAHPHARAGRRHAAGAAGNRCPIWPRTGPPAPAAATRPVANAPRRTVACPRCSSPRPKA